MKLFLPVVCSLLLLNACAHNSSEEAKDSAAASKDAKADSGPVIAGNKVTLPENSPMLSRIKSEAATASSVPTEEVDAPGKIEADPNRVSHVILPLGGRITSVLVHLGDPVQRGQTLLYIESPDADVALANYMQSAATVNVAKSALIKAQADYDRANDLFKNSAVAQKDVLTAESNLTQAKSSLDTANVAREQAGRRLDLLGLQRDQFGQKIAVKAPIAGKVLELTVAPNEYRNDTNASLMTIGDLSEVWVSSDVPETSIRFINRGEQVDLELQAYPGRVFHAKVMRIADTVDPVTRTVKVMAQLNNANGQLRPEMFGRIRHVESMKTFPLVPLTAIVQGEGGNFVYREIAKGSYERVPVDLGSRTPDKVAVTSGIRAGDLIVVDGAMLLKAA